MQLCSSSKDLTLLQESLQSYSESAPSLSRIHAGLLVLSCSSDEQWYRSILLDTVNLRQDGENLIEVGVVTVTMASWLFSALSIAIFSDSEEIEILRTRN